MDGNGFRRRITGIFQKYRYAILVLAAGILLMLLPVGEHVDPQTTDALQTVPESTEDDFEARLSHTLSKIDGAGKVEVFLSHAEGQKTIYQTDEDISAGDLRQETVVITSSDRNQAGLVLQVNPPVYQGAIVLCQGADNAAIRLSITQAVANVTGLGTNQISVLKMK